MINKRVLIVSTYPVKNPLHGGQKRVTAILNFYKTIFKEVKFVSIVNAEMHKEYDDSDILIESQDILKNTQKNTMFVDVFAARAIKEDQEVNRRFKAIIQTFNPHIIQIEQMYGFLEIKELLNELNKKPKIVLSSQNIEYEVKKKILTTLLKRKDESTENLLKEVKRIEKTAMTQSDLVIAVSGGDAARQLQMGAKRVVVVSNGIERVVPTPAALNHWQNFKKERKLKSLITFVGSGYPPNLFGLDSMIGRDLSFLPDGSALTLAGGISMYTQDIYGFWEKQNKKFWDRAVPLGQLSDDNLAGLIQESEIILLPITSGGGSNLKTAEAILSDKKIVATDFAFRSFERYKNLPNIYTANNRKEYTEAILKALNSQQTKRTPAQKRLAETVQWTYTLRPLEKEIKRIALGWFKYNLYKPRIFAKRALRRLGLRRSMFRRA